ncbi:MAG: M28 family peptidase, partial [Candidatus Eiseniibacteriota bacterium]
MAGEVVEERERDRRHRGAGRLVLTAAIAGLAALAASLPGLAAPPFPAARAMQHLVELCALGPRVPGTPAHAAARAYLRETLEGAGVLVEEQRFEALLPRFAAPVVLTNVIGRVAPELRPRVVLGAHWDSRPWADQDPDPSRHQEPVLGANDSASGCAILLALAGMCAARPPAVGVDLVFFDGEDAGLADSLESFCVGSREFARRLVEPPAYAIVLDMVGDRDLRIVPEMHGVRGAPDIQRYVWERARFLAIDAFADGPPIMLYDDHVPLLEAGV